MCVCVWEAGGQGGELINQKPPTPSRRKLAGERAEKGLGGGEMALECSSEKIPVLLLAAETSWHMLLREVRVRWGGEELSSAH